jgi:pimeloyl-ACP methyl ester carboxylesterase
VKDNQALLHRFIQAVSSEPVILVGNSMGGAISLLEAARHPERVAGLVLVDPAQPRARDAKMDGAVVKVFSLYALPVVGELFVRMRASRIGPEGVVRQMMKLCCADVAALPEESLQAHVALAREQFADMPWTHGAFLQAARSLLRLLADKRGYHAMAKGVTAPTLLLQGAEDRLVPAANSRELAALRPDWTYVELAGIGHVPMLEAPDAFTEAVLRWWERSQPRTQAA